MGFIDDVITIEKAVYGKDMRFAIANALMASHGALTAMMENVDELKVRVDALPSGGETPDDPGSADQPPATGCMVYGDACISIDAPILPYVASGEAIPV